jgi:diaminopimelate decarboxylase
LPGIAVRGADVHIGSQITDLSNLETAFRLLVEFVHTLRADGHTISHIDFGGGLGIPYDMDAEVPPEPHAYAAMVKRVAHNLGCTLMFEPGRLIVGNAGILVTRVLFMKRGEAKTFVVVDAAMNDLIRPSLYRSHHEILPLNHSPETSLVADVVGPICETGDFLARDREMPDVRPGDYLAISSAGAYGFVQASNYNSRPRAAEVLVAGAAWRVVRDRENYQDLIRGERI